MSYKVEGLKWAQGSGQGLVISDEPSSEYILNGYQIVDNRGQRPILNYDNYWRKSMYELVKAIENDSYTINAKIVIKGTIEAQDINGPLTPFDASYFDLIEENAPIYNSVIQEQNSYSKAEVLFESWTDTVGNVYYNQDDQSLPLPSTFCKTYIPTTKEYIINHQPINPFTREYEPDAIYQMIENAETGRIHWLNLNSTGDYNNTSNLNWFYNEKNDCCYGFPTEIQDNFGLVYPKLWFKYDLYTKTISSHPLDTAAFDIQNEQYTGFINTYCYHEHLNRYYISLGIFTENTTGLYYFDADEDQLIKYGTGEDLFAGADFVDGMHYQAYDPVNKYVLHILGKDTNYNAATDPNLAYRTNRNIKYIDENGNWGETTQSPSGTNCEYYYSFFCEENQRLYLMPFQWELASPPAQFAFVWWDCAEKRLFSWTTPIIQDWMSFGYQIGSWFHKPETDIVTSVFGNDLQSQGEFAPEFKLNLRTQEATLQKLPQAGPLTESNGFAQDFYGKFANGMAQDMNQASDVALMYLPAYMGGYAMLYREFRSLILWDNETTTYRIEKWSEDASVLKISSVTNDGVSGKALLTNNFLLGNVYNIYDGDSVPKLWSFTPNEVWDGDGCVFVRADSNINYNRGFSRSDFGNFVTKVTTGTGDSSNRLVGDTPNTAYAQSLSLSDLPYNIGTSYAFNGCASLQIKYPTQVDKSSNILRAKKEFLVQKGSV